MTQGRSTSEFVTRVSLEGRHYCDNAAITCVDFRFRIPDQQFLTSYFGTEDYDLFRWPGPARSTLLDPRFKDRLVERIKQVCIGLHRVKRFVVLLHWDCGAYGGSRSFTTSQAEETAYINDALKVKETLQRECPWVTVEVAYSHHHDGQLTYRLL